MEISEFFFERDIWGYTWRVIVFLNLPAFIIISLFVGFSLESMYLSLMATAAIIWSLFLLE